MNEEQILKIKESIAKLRDKSSRIYFFVHDTKGNAKASIKYIYDCALTLKKDGFNTIILHEKKDYTGVEKWLGENYMTELPHNQLREKTFRYHQRTF